MAKLACSETATYVAHQSIQVSTYNQGCGSAFISSGSGSSILGWIPIRIQCFNDEKLEKRGHPTLQITNLKKKFYFCHLWVIFALLDPDPDSESGSGIRIRIHWPDWIRIRIRSPAYNLIIRGADQLFFMWSWIRIPREIVFDLSVVYNQCWGSVTFWCGSGSIPLTNWSRSCSFRQWSSICQEKRIFFLLIFLLFLRYIYVILQKLFCRHYFSPLNTFMRIGKDPEPEPDLHLWLMDPDPEGPKTCGSCRSGSPTLFIPI